METLEKTKTKLTRKPKVETPAEIVLITEGPELEAWEKDLKQTAENFNKSFWDLGDKIIEGRDRFFKMDDFELAASITGLTIGTVSSYVSTCDNYKNEERIIGVPFTFHRVAQSIKDPVVRQSILQEQRDNPKPVVDFSKTVSEIRENEKTNTSGKKVKTIAASTEIKILETTLNDLSTVINKCRPGLTRQRFSSAASRAMYLKQIKLRKAEDLKEKFEAFSEAFMKVQAIGE